MHIITKTFRTAFWFIKVGEEASSVFRSLQCMHRSMLTFDVRFSARLSHTESKLEVSPEPANKNVTKFFYHLCEGKSALERNEWKELKKVAITSSRKITQVNFDGILMKSLLIQKNYALAKSYIDYLKAENCQANIVTLSTYMAICGSCCDQSSEEEILSIYKNLKDRKVLDEDTAENIIIGLCGTRLWKESIQLLKFLTHFNFTALNYVAWSAFRHRDCETAFQMLKNIVQSGKKPNDYVFDSCLDYAQTLEPKQSRVIIERFLSLLVSNMILVSKTTAVKIHTFYESMKDQSWKGVFTQVTRHGSCNSCKKQLKSFPLTEEEFADLRQAVLSRVLEGSDIFLASNPEELNRYKTFVSQSVPYDVVLDGLNVSYANKNNVKNVKAAAHQLQVVVEHFVKSKKKVFVLGKKHMLKWPRVNINAVQNMAVCFFVDNISNDDPFILYAAMMSGKNTLVVSKDLMRNHIFQLQDCGLSNLFKRWQKSHQIYLMRVERSGRVNCKEPLPYSIVVQGNMDEGLHIPYDDGEPCEPYEEKNNWLCLQRI